VRGVSDHSLPSDYKQRVRDELVETFSVSDSGLDGRIGGCEPDAWVELQEPFEPVGVGAVAVVEDGIDTPDIEAAVESYNDEGYSVFLVLPSDFTDDGNVDLPESVYPVEGSDLPNRYHKVVSSPLRELASGLGGSGNSQSQSKVSKTCPGCGSDTVCSVEEATRVFRVSKWGVGDNTFESASHICSWCKAVRYPDGDWERPVSVRQRSRELANASSRKSASDYRNKLKAGDGLV
jgi:hypothetical protein